MPARRKWKYRTCEVCGREYKAFPVQVITGWKYVGECHCGTRDMSTSDRKRRGRLILKNF